MKKRKPGLLIINFCLTYVEVQRTGTVELPGVVHDVLHYFVQNLFKECRPDPDVFDGLGGEGLRGAAGGGGALPSQGLVAHTLGPPVATPEREEPKDSCYTTLC